MNPQSPQDPNQTPVTPTLPPQQPVPPMPQQPIPPMPEPSIPQPQMPQPPAPSQMPMSPVTPPTNSRNKLLAIGVVVIVIIAVGVAVFALDKGKKQPASQPSSNNATSQSASDDTIPSSGERDRNLTRQIDISTLQTQMEAFFSETDHYPSLTDMNDQTWRTKNMPNLDPKAMVDPSTPDAAPKLVSKPTKGFFSYEVTTASGKSCEADDTKCELYTLTAEYEGSMNGQTSFTKHSLNQ